MPEDIDREIARLKLATNSVAASAASLLGSRLAVALLGVVFLGVSTRLLTLEEMALFAVYNIFCGLITVVCSLGLPASGIKLLPGLRASGEVGEASALVRLSLRVYGAGAALWTLILVASATPISLLMLKSDRFAGEIRIAALASACFGIYEATQLLLNGLQRYDRLSHNNVLTALCQRILSLGLFFIIGFRGYLVGFAIGSLAGALFGLAAVLPVMRHPPRVPPGWAGRQLRWSFPLYADGYLRYIYMQADQLIVGIFLAPAALSVYFIAKRFLHYCQMLVQSLLDPLSTKVAQLRQVSPSELRPVYIRSLRFFVMIFVPLSVLLAAASPLLLRIIGGSRYEEGAIPLALLFLSALPFALFAHFATFVFILGEPRERFFTNLASAGAQLMALSLLMPWLALPGLALARGIGFTAAIVHARARLARVLPGALSAGMTSTLLRCLPPALSASAIVAGGWLIVDNVWIIPPLLVPAALLTLVWYARFVLSDDDRAVLAAFAGRQGALARLCGWFLAL